MDKHLFELTAKNPREGTGLVFSMEGVKVVASLTRWMNIFGFFCFLPAAMALIGAFFAATTLGMTPLGVVLAIVGFGYGLAGMWVRSAGSDFQRGVLGDCEVSLGQGFRSLRAFLILFGVVSILHLAGQIERLL